MACVLLTGVTGQDGSYLAESLLAEKHDVHCIVRPSQTSMGQNLPDYLSVLFSSPNIFRYDIDLSDSKAVFGVCRDVDPDMIYHLGGPTRVDSNIGGNAGVFRTIFGSTKALLDAIRDRSSTKLFFAGTSEIFGSPNACPQDERTARHPRSMYGFAKLAATDLVERHRKKFGVFACTGILYNHESPRREPYFLSRKVTRGLVRVSLGLQNNIALGNLDAKRDWGYAPDYVDAMQRVLAHDEPDDYVIATGHLHSVRDLINIVCKALKLDPEHCVDQDARFYRPVESIPLCGKPDRITKRVGWTSQKPFQDIIEEMVENDLDAERQFA